MSGLFHRAPRGLGLLGVLVGAGLLWAAPVRAEIDSPGVRAGLEAFEALDYARAVELLERARGERLTVEELTATLRALGIAKVALGQNAGADFEALLRLAPEAKLDRTVSPHIRSVFEEARLKVEAERAKANPPVAPPAPRLTTPTPDPTTPATGAPVNPPSVPPAAVTPPAQPAAPAPDSDRPVWRRGWFWGVVGGVAAAAIVGGVAGGLLTRDGTVVVVPR